MALAKPLQEDAFGTGRRANWTSTGGKRCVWQARDLDDIEKVASGVLDRMTVTARQLVRDGQFDADTLIKFARPTYKNIEKMHVWTHPAAYYVARRWLDWESETLTACMHIRSSLLRFRTDRAFCSSGL